MASKNLVGIVMAAMINFTPISYAKNEIIVTPEAGIVYEHNQREGELFLKELADKGSKEDGWYYIPEKEIWIDHGAQIMSDRYLPDKTVILNKDIKKAIHYHIHPVRDPLEKRVKGVLPPSFEDFDYLSEEINYFKDRGTEIPEARIVDCGGYWSIDLKNSNMKQLEGVYTQALLDFKWEYENLLSDHTYEFRRMFEINKDYEVLKAIEKYFINKFEEDVARLGMKIEYHPID